jgi:hypothetical protein
VVLPGSVVGGGHPDGTWLEVLDAVGDGHGCCPLVGVVVVGGWPVLPVVAVPLVVSALALLLEGFDAGDALPAAATAAHEP